MDDEDIIKLNLDQQRQEYMARLEADQEEREPETTGPKKMGFGLLLGALTLALIQLGIEWLTLGVLGWILAAPISVLLWFVMRPYTKSLKTAKWVLGSSLVADSFPFVGLIPIDIIAIIYVFIKSRSAFAEHIANMAEKFKNKRDQGDRMAA